MWVDSDGKEIMSYSSDYKDFEGDKGSHYSLQQVISLQPTPSIGLCKLSFLFCTDVTLFMSDHGTWPRYHMTFVLGKIKVDRL